MQIELKTESTTYLQVVKSVLDSIPFSNKRNIKIELRLVYRYISRYSKKPRKVLCIDISEPFAPIKHLNIDPYFVSLNFIRKKVIQAANTLATKKGEYIQFYDYTPLDK